jgi:hypothetical protein
MWEPGAGNPVRPRGNDADAIRFSSAKKASKGQLTET